MKVAIIIPARLESTRLKRKLLLNQTGRHLIEHTYEAACQSTSAQEVVVATDSEEIYRVIQAAGGKAVMTSDKHLTGTDRIAEAATQLDADLIVNVQGDEPEIDGATIDRLIDLFSRETEAQIGTLATPISTIEDLLNSSCVKVVVDQNGKALYFSRSPIPGSKIATAGIAELIEKQPHAFLQHIGVYAYRNQCLQEICNLSPTKLEEIESLEQLRFLGHGYPIHVQIVEHHAQGIDTAEDYASFVNRLTKG